MTSRRFLIHAVRSVAVFLAATSLSECTSDAPSGPRVLDVRATQPELAKSLSGPAVSSANPAFGDQGTTLDVQILGSGFTNGASVSWLLNGVADNHVHTNSSKFVSSAEIDANITIDPNATLAFWDVQVALIGGKNGVGSDAFEVTSARILGSGTVGGDASVYGANDQGQVVGAATAGSATDAWVYDPSTGMVNLGGGLAHDIDALGAFVVGASAGSTPIAWVRSGNTWLSRPIPPSAGTSGGTAMATTRIADGTSLVAGWEVLTHKGATNPTRAEVWQRATDGTWSGPQIYTTPPGFASSSAYNINAQGEVVGALENYHGIVWENPTTYTVLDGNAVGINAAGTLIVGQNASFFPVYWWKDPSTNQWHLPATPLPSVVGASCPDGFALGVNDAGVIVGWSCTALGKSATVWRLDLSGPTPVLAAAPTQLPTLGVRNSKFVQVAHTVTNSAPYVVAGAVAISTANRVAVQWSLR